MLTLTDYEIEKRGLLWDVTIPFDKSVPQLQQNEYEYDPIIIVEPRDDGDLYMKLDVMNVLESDNHKFITFICESHKDEKAPSAHVKARGGARPGSGRPKVDGVRHTWVVPADIEQVANERGTAFIWEAVRFKLAFERMQATFDK